MKDEGKIEEREQKEGSAYLVKTCTERTYPMMLPCEVDIGKGTGDEYPSSLLALGGQGQEEREERSRERED